MEDDSWLSTNTKKKHRLGQTLHFLSNVQMSFGQKWHRPIFFILFAFFIIRTILNRVTMTAFKQNLLNQRTTGSRSFFPATKAPLKSDWWQIWKHLEQKGFIQRQLAGDWGSCSTAVKDMPVIKRSQVWILSESGLFLCLVLSNVQSTRKFGTAYRGVETGQCPSIQLRLVGSLSHYFRRESAS